MKEFLSTSYHKFSVYCSQKYPEFIFGNPQLQIIKKLREVEVGKCRRLMVFMPPRFGKSILISELFPAWYIGRNQKHQIISTTYSQEFASDWGRKVKNQLEAEAYKYTFKTTTVKDSHSSRRFYTIHGGCYNAVGRGGAMTGKGAHLLIVDDICKNIAEALSPVIKKSIFDWFKTTARSRLMKNGKIIIINTRWTQDDLCGLILADPELKEGWDVLSIPALDVNNQSTFPEMFSTEALLETKREVGSMFFEALFQQNPVPDTGNLIKKDWIKAIDILPQRYDMTIQSWDLSFKGGTENDYVVGTVWGQIGANKYLIDMVRGQWDFVETINQMIMLSNKYPDATAKLVEDKANGPAVIATLKNKVSGIIPYNPETSKIARLVSVTPEFEAGNVYFYKGHWHNDLISELLYFPKGNHDDIVDSITQALLYLKKTATFYKYIDTDNICDTLVNTAGENTAW